MKALPTSPLLTKGDFIGDYQILSLMGCGPSGFTYLAMNPKLGREVVIKVLVELKSFSKQWWDRLDIQSAYLMRFTSSYHNKPLAIGKLDAYCFTVKELVGDESQHPCLGAFCKKHGGKLPEFTCLQIFFQVLQALNEAFNHADANHAHLFHGNLKPSNVLIHSKDEKGLEVQLTDFQPYGLFDPEIMQQWVQFYEDFAKDTPLPGENTLKQFLTALYAQSPYLCYPRTLGSAGSLQGDTFALGVMLYEMLIGQLPCGKFLLPTQLNPSLHPLWDEWLGFMLDTEAPENKDFYPQTLELMKQEFPEACKEKQKDQNPRSDERLSISPKGMLYIPAGEFSIGSKSCGEDATPQHMCSSEGFYLDRYLVTNQEFTYFVRETGYVTTAEKEKVAPIWLEGKWKILEGISWKNPTGQLLPKDFDNHPVTQVTYEDVLAYCQWAEKRLPSEQEWEYAALGGKTSSLYPWGNTLHKHQANYLSDRTTKVGVYPPNGYGLYDIIGNVWEWTCSPYLPYPGNTSKDLPFNEALTVVRGGAWLYDAAYCQLSFRNANQKHHSYPTLGFRCAKDFD